LPSFVIRIARREPEKSTEIRGPQTNIDEEIGLARLAKVVTRIKAVGTAVGRVKSWLALKDFLD
jgi:hypothetical protein